MVTRRTIGGQIVSSICNTFGRFQNKIFGHFRSARGSIRERHQVKTFSEVRHGEKSDSKDLQGFPCYHV